MPTTKAKTAKTKTTKKTPTKQEPTTAKGAALTISVFGLDGRKVKSISLPKEIFSTEAKPKLLAQYVRVYLTNQRQGNASTKTRAEVAGSTKKIYKQKGTGRARHGSRKAPIFKGGGIIGGPKPKEYNLKLNKKQRRKAFFSALTLLQKEGKIIGLNDASLKTQAKTKLIAKLFKQLGLEGQKITLVLPKMEKNNLVLAARNINNLSLQESKSLNAYTVLNSQKIIFVEQALKVLQEHFVKHEN